MSFFDDASLVFLPSGQAGKDGKAYSMKPTNGDGDFTFSRGSNLTATRVDSNGLIEKGRENLLLQSNQFDTTWALSSTSVTSGQGGYDGSSDAWLLNSTTTGSPRIQQTISKGGVSNFSVYAKAATDDYIQLKTSGISSDAWFNLSTGAVTNTSGSAYVDSNITSVGNGWYRCSVTFNGTISALRIYPASAFGTYSTSGNGVYIQDAQLEQGLVATEYIESGASTGLAGILEDSPRFDYSGGASCPSLLLEGSRTNLIEQSEYITDGTAITAVNNDTQSPEGLVNATRFRLGVDESATRHRKIFSQSVASGEDYSFSVFFKEADAQWIQLLGNTIGGVFGSQVYVNFDLQNGVKGNVGTSVVDSGIEDYGNGWYRCYMVATAQATATGFFEILTTNNTDSGRYPSYENTTAINYCYVYGAQVEEGSYPTSYIPNHSGGSVTREADSCSDAGDASTFNDTEGVLYAEIAALADDLTFRSISLSDGTNNNRVIIRYRTTTNIINFLLSAGGSVIRNAQHSVTNITDYHKVAIKYKDRDIGIFVDGVKIATYNDTFTLSSLSEVSFTDGSGSDVFYGKPKQVLVFNTALSDVEMITLTS